METANLPDNFEETCHNCWFFRSEWWIDHSPGNGVGQCRRHAPRIPPQNRPDEDYFGEWPFVDKSEWCGEWKGKDDA